MISTLITPGLWLDTDEVILAALIPSILAYNGRTYPPESSSVSAMPVRGVIRYVKLADPPGGKQNTSNDASAGELERLTGAGLGVMLVQHVRGPGLWRIAEHDGAADAQAAVEWAERCEYPLGSTLYQDLEAVEGTSAETIEYCQAWGNACNRADYQAGLYVGYSVPLAPGQLYALPHTTYWHANGAPAVAVRGYCGTQDAVTATIGGVPFDRNTFVPDARGDLPRCATSGPISAAA